MTIKPINNILDVECAGGQTLPYYGYIEVSLECNNLPCSNEQQCLMLVVPDSRYNKSVPILLGTNILSLQMSAVQQNFGRKYLQIAPLHTPWYLAFRCLSLREKEMIKNNNRIALVRSAERKKIIIPANSSITLSGYIEKEVDYFPTCALLQQTHNSAIPADFDITPGVVNYKNKNNGKVNVQVSNVTTQTISIQPKAILCELQPVTIESLDYNNSKTKFSKQNTHLEFVKIADHLTSEQKIEAMRLINNFADAFSKGDLDIGHTDVIRHRIQLDDNRPFKQKHRRIPPSMYDEVREHLKQLLAANIIRKSYSPWSSNVVLARKKDGTLRMCIDFRQFNQRTIQDSYALPRTEEIFDSLAGSKYFSILDMKSGYHQVELEEQSKARTAFTVGPLGFF